MRYRLLDPLRGLAALWVFAFHLEWPPSLTGSDALFRFAKMGSMGVVVFFVISGYCICAAAKRAALNAQPAPAFLYRRFRRVYPPFWFSILLPLCVPFLLEFISMLKTGTYSPPHPRFAHWGMLDWVGLATLTKIFEPSGADLQTKFTPLNAVYWSLAIEIQFYIVAALAVKCRTWFYRLLLLVTGVSIPCIFWSGLDISGLFLPYWPMFAMGVILFGLVDRGLTPQRLLGKRSQFVGLIALIAGFALPLILAGWSIHMHALAFSAIFAVVIYFAYALEDIIMQLHASPRRTVRFLMGLWTLLGAMSYSIYLAHVPLSQIGDLFARHIFTPNTVAFNVAVLAATCGMIYPFYRFCEAPFVISSKQSAPPRNEP